jgi:hypothetical protein
LRGALQQGHRSRLLARATDQMKARLVLVIRSDRKRFYEQGTLCLGDDVADKFQSAAYEIDEAAKCFALDRYTAAVFHLMRTMEFGIKAVARCLQIPDPIKPAERNWGKMLGRIAGGMNAKWPTSADRTNGDGAIFEGLHASLDAIKNAWRNPTMHVENNYNEEEADHIFGVVMGFMKKLASRCDENGLPSA